MNNTDPRIDTYIAEAADFAQPILIHLRRLVHRACPPVVETIKWSMPFFEHHGPLCMMAGFKQHCTFGFWKWKLLTGEAPPKEAMGSFGRITEISDLPEEKVLEEYLRKAMQLNEQGIKAPRATAKKPAALVVPANLASFLESNTPARETFAGFSHTHRKDYLDWLSEARTTATREKRLALTKEWLAEGKVRHWKNLCPS